jgi:glycosyltransferase involved in cell wall biosynthesis
MSREWVKQGHDVTVLAATYSHLRKVNPVVEKDFTEQHVDGVRYLWVKAPAYKSNNHMRIINIMTFYNKVKYKAKELAERYKPDIVIGSSTYPHDMRLVSRIADISGGKKIFEVHDLWPATMIYVHGFSENNPFTKYIAKAESFAYENADAVVSIWSHVNLRMQELGVDKPYSYIPNGIIIDGSSKVEEAPKELKKQVEALRTKGKFITMYLGGFAAANALEEFIDSADYLDENQVLMLVGDGMMKEEYINRVSEKSRDKVIFVPKVNKTQVKKTLELADCCYIGAKKSPLYRYGAGMNKIFDYMYASRPIIFGIETPSNPIKEADCGITIEAGSPQAIAEAIKALNAAPKEKLEEMGRRGYDFALENYGYKRLSSMFINAMQSLLDERKKDK